MAAKINFEKSILSKRIIYDITPLKIIEIIGDYFFGVLFIIAGLLVFMHEITDRYQQSVFLILLSGILTSYMATGCYLMTKLLKIEGTDIDKNRDQVVALIKRKYPKLVIYPGQRIIIAEREHKYIAFDRKIIVVLDDRDLYINSCTIGRADSKLMFMAVPNYIRCKALAKEFR